MRRGVDSLGKAFGNPEIRYFTPPPHDNLESFHELMIHLYFFSTLKPAFESRIKKEKGSRLRREMSIFSRHGASQVSRVISAHVPYGCRGRCISLCRHIHFLDDLVPTVYFWHHSLVSGCSSFQHPPHDCICCPQPPMLQLHRHKKSDAARQKSRRANWKIKIQNNKLLLPSSRH